MIHIDNHIFQLGWEPTTKHHISFLDFTVDFREFFKVFKLIWLFRTINSVVSRQGVKFTPKNGWSFKSPQGRMRTDDIIDGSISKTHLWTFHPLISWFPPPKKKPGTDHKKLTGWQHHRRGTVRFHTVLLENFLANRRRNHWKLVGYFERLSRMGFLSSIGGGCLELHVCIYLPTVGCCTNMY